MKDSLKKIAAVLIILITAFGWFVTIEGIPGHMDPVANDIQKGLDIEGGVYVVLEAQGTEDLTDAELADLMDRTQAVVANRVDALGIAAPTVSVEGGNRLRVELPGITDAEEAAQLIGKTAQLKFLYADGGLIMDGDVVDDAALSTNSDSGGYVVELNFNSEGAKKFEEATTKTSQGGVPATLTTEDGEKVPDNSVVIMLDNEIISYPTAEKVISGDTCIIEGNFTEDEASQLAALIKGGSLPTELKEISSSSQTATIGLDAFHKSVMAGLIGLLIVFAFMIFGYRAMGVAADIALALYVVIILVIMAVAGSVLTLPGIAGLILSIGMAVDANVIIFARIREEILGGKSIRVATKTGYKRALTTVIDSQITTLIATIIMYQLGTNDVKGFAWTLMIGIVVSIFTAVFVTQLFLNIMANSKFFNKPGFYGIKKNGRPTLTLKKQIHFIEKRKIFYCISVGIIILGLIFTIVRGFNYGIDFTGGTMVNIDMGKQVSTQEIKDIAESEGINSKQMSVVYSGDNNEQVIIKTNESLNTQERKDFIAALQKEFKFSDGDILSSEHFGPSVGNELKKNALMSVGIAAIGMLIYIRFRFKQWRFGAAAILGVLHDVLILMSFYVIFGVTVNNPFIAAILTVVGYSINDTIVVFDRVRENSKYARKENTTELLNKSINQTLSRSVMTSFTTLIIMIPLLIMAGSTIREFVLPLMVGVLAGCMSSIFICSPLYYEFSSSLRKSKYERQQSKNKYQGAPKKKYEGKKSEKKKIEKEKSGFDDGNVKDVDSFTVEEKTSDSTTMEETASQDKNEGMKDTEEKKPTNTGKGVKGHKKPSKSERKKKGNQGS